jgi:hypothetical protein
MNASEAGEMAGTYFIAGLNKMFEKMSPEDSEKAWAKIAEIDWSSWDAGK